MERSSWVLQHGNPKILFSQRSSKLNFNLCRRAEIVQVGLNMHLYDDIGDASSTSSFCKGSTSSFFKSIYDLDTKYLLEINLSSHSDIL